MNIISMSKMYILNFKYSKYCKIHDKDGKKLGIKCETESADDFDDEIDNLGLQNLALISGNLLFSQP